MRRGHWLRSSARDRAHTIAPADEKKWYRIAFCIETKALMKLWPRTSPLALCVPLPTVGTAEPFAFRFTTFFSARRFGVFFSLPSLSILNGLASPSARCAEALWSYSECASSTSNENVLNTSLFPFIRLSKDNRNFLPILVCNRWNSNKGSSTSRKLLSCPFGVSFSQTTLLRPAFVELRVSFSHRSRIDSTLLLPAAFIYISPPTISRPLLHLFNLLSLLLCIIKPGQMCSIMTCTWTKQQRTLIVFPA